MACPGPSPKRPLWICGSKEPQQMKLCTRCNSLLSERWKDTAGRGTYKIFISSTWLLDSVEMGLCTPSFQVIKGGKGKCSVKMQQSSPWKSTTNNKNTQRINQKSRKRLTFTSVHIPTPSISSSHYLLPIRFLYSQKAHHLWLPDVLGPETYPIEPRSSPLKLNLLPFQRFRRCHEPLLKIMEKNWAGWCLASPSYY